MKPENLLKLEQEIPAERRAFCKCDIIEYGTSPRYGWITRAGEMLKDYILSKTDDELYDICMNSEEYVPCYPEMCQCKRTPSKKTCNPLFDRQNL